MRRISTQIILLNLVIAASANVYYTKLHQNETYGCTILSEETLRKFKGFHTEDENAFYSIVRPAVVSPGDAKIDIKDQSKIIEIYSRKPTVMTAHVSTLCKTKTKVKALPAQATVGPFAPEVISIIDGGDKANRIDVVFMGDGYQLAQRQQFLDDIQRLTTEMFEGITFRSYLPLFNIWAIFVESVDSGIGYDGAKNTPFRLYREAGQLRGIYPGNASYARTVCLLTGTSGCDYPSLIGNDDFYGGLGGEFVISTKSNRTGTIVLRHEMGHNFADVGEEYDGGSVYSGVNAAQRVSSLGWQAWLSGPAREQRAIYRLLEYPWQDLSTGPVSLTFNSDGNYRTWYMVISVTAAGEEDSLEFSLDGQLLPWTSSGSEDREFYDWFGQEGFTAGNHILTIRSKTPPTNQDIPRMVASVDLHEFGDAEEFVQDNSYINAYPTWNYNYRKTFRPTNAGCLMRNMTHSSFCSVCKEGIWHQFLQRINLIDSVVQAPSANPDGTRNVTLSTLKLGQLRAPGNEVPDEMLEIRWTRNQAELINLRDQFNIVAQSGNWTVQVQFVSSEIRTDPQGLLIEAEEFIVA